MILFEKYITTNGKNEVLNSWTKLFNNVDALIEYLDKHKDHLLSSGRLDSYKIVIRDVWTYIGDDKGE